MTSYASDELISSSQFAKRFGTYLSQVTSHSIDKLAILKNNRVEAVIVSKDNYERMNEALEYMENQEIAHLVKERTTQPHNTLTQEEMLEHLGISADELK